MVDTKAPISLIDPTLAKTILKLSEKPIGKRRLQLLQRLGHKTDSTVEAIIKFDTKVHLVKLYVSPQTQYDVIFGRDFLKKANLNIKMRQNKSTLKSKREENNISKDEEAFDILLVEEQDETETNIKTKDEYERFNITTSSKYDSHLVFKNRENTAEISSGKTEITGLQVPEILSTPINLDQAIVDAITKFPFPRTAKDVHSFLKLTGEYRQFIEIYAWQANPLSDLIKKNVRFNWTDDCQIAFNTLKEMFSAAPTLKHFNQELPTTLVINSCAYGISGIVSQEENNTRQIVTYASKTLSRCQQKYPTKEIEILAIVWTVTKFKNFIYGYHFEIRTTQCALCYLADIMHSTDRLSKWYSTLQKYDFTLIDKNGKSHQNTQCLSRRQFSAKTLTPHKNNKEFLVYVDNYPDTKNNNLKSVNLESVMKNNMPSEAKTSEEMPEAGATKRNNSSDDKNNS